MQRDSMKIADTFSSTCFGNSLVDLEESIVHVPSILAYTFKLILHIVAQLNTTPYVMPHNTFGISLFASSSSSSSFRSFHVCRSIHNFIPSFISQLTHEFLLVSPSSTLITINNNLFNTLIIIIIILPESQQWQEHL